MREEHDDVRESEVQADPPAPEVAAPEARPRTIEDLFKGELPDDPWQNKRYSSDNLTWQAAAMRKRAHFRRTGVSLGVVTVDLSGPREPTPRPGNQICRDMASYFLVLTARPDTGKETQESAAEPAAAGADEDSSSNPLIYAALLGAKSEAPDAIKTLIAQMNDEHGSIPHTIFFRIHSDRGGEFVNDDLKRYCLQHAIRRTTTQGHDPNANATAEKAVGVLKRRTRYLLSGARLPTQFWGVGVLAAAQLERADAGLGSYPRIPFGTRGMMVISPPPRSAWALRAEPCTIFGICDDVPHAHWVYQRGWVRARTDLQPQGMSEEDLTWVKLHVSQWDPPDRPLDLPDEAEFDAGALPQLRADDVPAATRETATCPACLQTRRGRKRTQAHSLVWGECLRAPRPVVQYHHERDHHLQPAFEDIDPEHAVHVNVAASAHQSAHPDQHHRYHPVPVYHQTQKKMDSPRPFETYPHALLAMATSTAATWGSASGREPHDDGDTTTDLALTDSLSDLVDDVESNFSFDDDFAVGHSAPPDCEVNWEVNDTEPIETLNEITNPDESVKEEAEYDDDEDTAKHTNRRRRRGRIRRLQQQRFTAKFVAEYVIPIWCASAALEPHLTDLELNAMQQLQMESGNASAGVAEPGKTVVAPEVVRKAEGADLDAWILAAQAEHDRFLELNALQTATQSEVAEHGQRPLPMLNVWTRTDDDLRKCRTVIAGNLQRFDPTAQRWTAQAEPSSIFIATKMAAVRRWTISKVDVKAAFLNAPIPEDELILVSPPTQWVMWGIVPKGTVWRLNKAVYGLRRSPKWCADERDEKFEMYDLECTLGFFLDWVREVPFGSEPRRHTGMVNCERGATRSHHRYYVCVRR